MKIVIKGLGLIGGSMALALKEQPDIHISGMDISAEHCHLALRSGLVQDIVHSEDSLSSADCVILATPVDQIEQEICGILDATGEGTLIVDTGSTKAAICQAVSRHPERYRFVAAHPLAGTEHSGPLAAVRGLFAGKKNIICESEKTSGFYLDRAVRMFEDMGMHTVYMSPDEHDRHAAYVSHLSHVSSFMLGLTVMDIEQDESTIFELAGTGFASTVRLAKSHPVTWTSIFIKNRSNLVTALDEYIGHLINFKECLLKNDPIEMERLLTSANRIKHILK
jgi:prephenate dehydrogenase